MTRNTPKFDPRWNGGLSRTGLHTGTRFSVHSGRNGTEYTTLLAMAQRRDSVTDWAWAIGCGMREDGVLNDFLFSCGECGL